MIAAQDELEPTEASQLALSVLFNGSSRFYLMFNEVWLYINHIIIYIYYYTYYILQYIHMYIYVDTLIMYIYHYNYIY